MVGWIGPQLVIWLDVLNAIDRLRIQAIVGVIEVNLGQVLDIEMAPRWHVDCRIISQASSDCGLECPLGSDRRWAESTQSFGAATSTSKPLGPFAGM